MLSVDDIAGMRATIDSSLPDTCTVVTDTATSDDAGGQTYSSSSSVSIPCRVAPRLAAGQLKDAETDSAGRFVTQAPWLITFPAETPVAAVSRIADQHGRQFEAFAVLARRSDELATLVLCRLINEGAG